MKNKESEDDFKKRLDLYLKGRLSAGEKEQLEKQLEDFRKSDPTPYEFNQQHSNELWKKISQKTVHKDKNRGRFWIWVAAIVICTATAILFTRSWNPDTVETSNKIILADGTIVWLKHNATLDYSDFSGDHREVILNGEALFEVAKKREHPFVIHCGRYEARVLGTSFNIKASDSSIELTVLTGSVALSSLNTDSNVIVNSNEHVVFTRTTQSINKIAHDAAEVKNVIANTEYDMHFEDTQMRDVIARVEGKFNVNVRLQDPDIGNCMISADFTDQSLPITLTMISEALGFQYEISGDEVVINGSGCEE